MHYGPRSKIPWTAEQDKMLVELRAQRMPWVAVAARVGRSLEACCGRYRTITPKESRKRYVSVRSWSVDEETLLHSLVAEKKPILEIARTLGRTRSMVHSKIYYDERPQRRVHIEMIPRVFVPPDREADRVRRMAAERDLTGEFFGDPAPGQSALDKKQGAFA